MNLQTFLKSPRHKLMAACALILMLALLAPAGSLSAAGAARLVLGLGGLGALAWWLRTRTLGPARFVLPERLRVVSRTGLSARCGMALVEADGQRYLVTYGDSFANVHPAAAPALPPSAGLAPALLARRPASPRRPKSPRAAKSPKGKVP